LFQFDILQAMPYEPQFTARKAGIESAEIILEPISHLFFYVDRYNQENSSEDIVYSAINTAIKNSISIDDSTTPSLLDEFTIGTDDISSMAEQTIQQLKTDRKFNFELPETKKNFINILRAKKSSQKTSFANISSLYGPTLNQLGLSIETVSGETFSLSLRNPRTRVDLKNNQIVTTPTKIFSFKSSEIIYNISDHEKFISFLNGLNPESLENHFKDGLIDISDCLTDQLVDHYDYSYPNKNDDEYITNIGPIISQYQRLGMGDAIQQLSVYYEHLNMEVLEDFLTLERANFIVDQKEEPLDPTIWQIEYSPEIFEINWNIAFEILARAKNNPKAKGFYYNLKMVVFPKFISDFFDKIEQASFISEDKKLYYTNILSLINEQLERS
jgi:hypothetical protein